MWLIVAIVVIVFSYWALIRPHKYWIKRGVKQGKPDFLLGDSWRPILHLQSQFDMIQMMYNSSSNARYSGVYEFLKPALLIKDPDLIKQVTVKDFEHFVDHRSFITDDIDPLFSKNLFLLKAQKWREMRARLSPAFTSSKMKHMFSLISQSGEQFVNHFLKQEKDLITIEMKDTFTRFTNDVIANTAFGVECDSLRQPENEFYMMGKETTDFSNFWRSFKFAIMLLAPKIANIFKIKLFPAEVGDFFKKLVKENITSREKYGIVRPDMINLLMEAKKHGHMKYEESQNIQDAGFATVEESEYGKNINKPTKTELTDEEMVAQVLIFFFAGFDSVSGLMCFMSYELGINPEVQEKLRQEVDEARKRCNGKLTYEVLAGMKYLDMVTSETLRKWPNAPASDRVCTKPYTIEPQRPDEKSVHLKEGDIIFFPIYALHRDPQYFPEPDRFDPERFNDENKHNIKPYSYLPFGSGPRNCIGSRLALLETKTLFYYILSHFEIVPVEKTRIPLKLQKGLVLLAEGGFWLGLKRRSQK